MDLVDRNRPFTIGEYLVTRGGDIVVVTYVDYTPGESAVVAIATPGEMEESYYIWNKAPYCGLRDSSGITDPFDVVAYYRKIKLKLNWN